jgi:hypothetical protein
VGHRKRAVDVASTRLKAWLRQLRPQSPATLYKEMLRGAAYYAGSSIAATLVLWLQSRH